MVATGPEAGAAVLLLLVFTSPQIKICFAIIDPTLEENELFFFPLLPILTLQI
ncbi:hypothetical protein AAHE18_15G151700 [Arachis hypogaea]